MPTSDEREELDDEERDVCQNDRRCPDCNAKLVEGPHGGLSVNWCCSRVDCGSKFNDMGPFGVVRISKACPNAVSE